MFISIFSYFDVMTKASKVTTMIIMTALVGLGMLFVVPPMSVSAQENMTNTDQNMTNTDQNMTSLESGTVSGAARGTS